MKLLMTQVKLRLGAFANQLEIALIFLLSFAFATIFGSIVTHRNSDPFNIVNLANLSFEANYVRIILFVLSGFLIFFSILYIRKKYSKFLKPAIAIMGASIVLVNVLLPLPTQQIDSFHHGEQLSPALEYKQGKELYSDLFFLHGAGEDIIVPNLAFGIFNNGEPSIGAYLLIYKFIQAITILILFALLAVILRHRLTFLLATTWISGSIYLYAGLGSGKYIFLYLVLLLYYKILVTPPKNYMRWVIPLLIGVVSSVGLFYSIEVGVVLIVINLLVIAGLLFTSRNKDGFTFGVRQLRLPKAYIQPLIIIGSALLIQLSALLLMGPQPYLSFLQQTFSDIPKYQSALFSFGSPSFQGDIYSYGFWLPILLLPLVILMLATLVFTQFKRNRTISPSVVYAAVLLLACLVTLRSGVGRPDFFHVATVAMPFFVAAFFIVEEFLQSRVTDKQFNSNFTWAPFVFILLLLWPQTTWNPGTMIVSKETSKQTVKDILSLPSKPDDAWLSDEQKSVVSYIKQNSTKDDGLFVLTAEPIYYYLTDRSNPSRFYLTWFADPQPFTNELLDALKTNPPKQIIYSGPSQYDNIDGIRIQDRVPEVDAWILKEYPVKIKINNTTILTKE